MRSILVKSVQVKDVECLLCVCESCFGLLLQFMEWSELLLTDYREETTSRLESKVFDLCRNPYIPVELYSRCSKYEQLAMLCSHCE